MQPLDAKAGPAEPASSVTTWLKWVHGPNLIWVHQSVPLLIHGWRQLAFARCVINAAGPGVIPVCRQQPRDVRRDERDGARRDPADSPVACIGARKVGTCSCGLVPPFLLFGQGPVVPVAPQSREEVPEADPEPPERVTEAKA